MKLELKHIALYLPFGLKMQLKRHFLKYGETPILTLNGLALDAENICICEFVVPYEGVGDLVFAPLPSVKPILKPISIFGDSDDLRKVHEFIGLGKWCDAYDEYFKAWFNDASNIDRLILQAPQEIFNYFLANHYDVFGLINEGLATAE